MMPNARKIPTDPAIAAVLPSARYMDTFSIDLDQTGLDAEAAARQVLTHPPAWIARLMRWRDRAVSLLGLKGVSDHKRPDVDEIGGFPVVSRSQERVVLGFDDRHLDFRIVVDAVPAVVVGTCVMTTTLVAPHNLLGRCYLAMVLPFHRAIVPAMLNTLGALERHPI